MTQRTLEGMPHFRQLVIRLAAQHPRGDSLMCVARKPTPPPGDRSQGATDTLRYLSGRHFMRSPFNRPFMTGRELVYIDLRHTCPFMNLNFFAGVLLSSWLLHEPVTLQKVAGIRLIVFGTESAPHG